MAVRNVLRYPHPSLKRVARPLGAADADHVRQLSDDLIDTMRAHPRCTGLAAPQLDELVRMIVVDVTGHRLATCCHGLLVAVNPRVVQQSGAEMGREGCLSIPDFTANVTRATEVVIEALAPDESRLEIRSSGFEARVLLHEIDHLDGLLFLDRVTALRTDVFPRKRRGSGGRGAQAQPPSEAAGLPLEWAAATPEER